MPQCLHASRRQPERRVRFTHIPGSPGGRRRGLNVGRKKPRQRSIQSGEAESVPPAAYSDREVASPADSNQSRRASGRATARTRGLAARRSCRQADFLRFDDGHGQVAPEGSVMSLLHCRQRGGVPAGPDHGEPEGHSSRWCVGFICLPAVVDGLRLLTGPGVLADCSHNCCELVDQRAFGLGFKPR
jgi:hypothetical protein